MAKAQIALRAAAWSDQPSDAQVDRGAVYTPDVLADWVAKQLLTRLPQNSVVWDLACGDGALLSAVRRLDATHRLAGIDIDVDALQRARGALPGARLLCRDALVPDGEGLPAENLIAQLGGRPDGVILNPPWGATLDRRRSAYTRFGYELAFGQFDTYDLFAELALAVLRPGGSVALILPDSLLSHEHRSLRRLLLGQTHLDLVARLGEGFFPAVYRGAMVVLARSGIAPKSHRVTCFRLGAADRKAVLRKERDLDELLAREGHRVPQTQFATSPQLRLELDVRENERRHLTQFEVHDRMVWRDVLASGRGVELSKNGWVLTCPACSRALPQPRAPRAVRCRGCDVTFQSAEAPREQIVRSYDGEEETGWRALIVGEDVHRYSAVPSRALRLGLPGINYKAPADFDGPKLLVRKTGVGLSVAIDRTGAYTTQVVYQYKPLIPSDAFVLDYLAAILSSRFFLAYHLSIKGDTEWRSHPYVTQRVIEDMPIPTPTRGSRAHRYAKELAKLGRRRAAQVRSGIDLELKIEALVAGLYGLRVEDWRWALRVLADAQSLEGIKELRLPSATPMIPVILN